MMRLIHSGAFDKYPGLRIILGHLGEGLPFPMTCIDSVYERPWIDPEARSYLKKEAEPISEREYVRHHERDLFQGRFHVHV